MKLTMEISSVNGYDGKSFFAIYCNDEIKFVLGSLRDEVTDVLYFCLTGFVMAVTSTCIFVTKE